MFDLLTKLEKSGKLESFCFKRTKMKRSPNKWYCGLKMSGRLLEMTGESPEFVASTIVELALELERLSEGSSETGPL